MRRTHLPRQMLAALAARQHAANCGVPAAALASSVLCSEHRQLSSATASTSGSSSTIWPFVAVPVLAALAAGGLRAAQADAEQGEQESLGFQLVPLASRQRTFFKYEKRIRDNSALDKIFEYFCSQEKDGLKYMLPVDMLRAVVPTYPPSESAMVRSGHLDGERVSAQPAAPTTAAATTDFFKQFDTDGDGLISYGEFLLLLTLLAIPDRDIKTIFDVVDLDGNGVVDAEEFKLVVERLQDMAHVHASRVGRSAKLSSSASDCGILVSFFGRDGTGKLHLADFTTFLQRLHREAVFLEFLHYDYKGRGSIPAVDFGRSLVASIPVRRVDRLLDRVDALPPPLASMRVTFDDFLAVHSLTRRLHTLQVALDFFEQVERRTTKADLDKLLRKLLGVALAPHVLDIIFAVFGEGDALNTPLFLEALQRKEVMWARRRAGLGSDSSPSGLLSRAASCFKKCSTSDIDE